MSTRADIKLTDGHKDNQTHIIITLLLEAAAVATIFGIPVALLILFQ